MGKKGKSVMIVGMGDLGGWVLEFLARRRGISKLITADIREDYGSSKTYCAAVGSSLEGYNKEFEFHKIDVNDIDGTAELLKRLQPDFIYSAISLQAWWVRRLMPADVLAKMKKVGTGPLLTFQMPLIYNLMRAVKKSGIDAYVLNHSTPDFINPMLCRSGLPVTLGAGNLQFYTAFIRHRISELENVPLGDVTIYGFGVHATVMRDLKKEPVSHLFKCMVRDKDITGKYDIDAYLSEKANTVPTDKSFSWIVHPYIAACAVTNIVGILNDTNELSHSPGPNGLIGCYPVRLSAGGAEVVLPDGMTLEEAIKINTDGMHWDGYQEVKDNGAIVFTDEATKAYQEILGIEMKELRIEDSVEVAKEMSAAWKSLEKKYNVNSSLY